MSYVPNADDSTQPTDAVLAETAQAEFRALKVKINAMVGLSTSGESLPALYITVAALTATEAADIANLTAQLAGKAPVVSPAFAGTPTAPTPAVGDNSADIATTSFVFTAIQNATFVTLNPAAITLITPAVLPATASVFYVDNQANGVGTIQLPAVPTLQSKYTLTDPTNSWGAFPWTLDGNGNSFYTPLTGVVAGPVTINFPDCSFSVGWNTVQNAWEFI